MGALLLYRPVCQNSERFARIIWQGSQALLTATRCGRRDLAADIARCLANTREDPRCSPAMARIISSAVGIALRQFGGATPDDGEAA